MSKVIGGETVAYVAYDEDKNFVVVDAEGNKGEPCKFCDENDKTILLTANESGCKYISRKKVEAYLNDPEKDGYYPLPNKVATEVGISVGGFKLPTWSKWLTEQKDIDDLNAIMERAKTKAEADKKVPLTEEEKLDAKIAALMAKKAALHESKKTEEDE